MANNKSAEQKISELRIHAEMFVNKETKEEMLSQLDLIEANMHNQDFINELNSMYDAYIDTRAIAHSCASDINEINEIDDDDYIDGSTIDISDMPVITLEFNENVDYIDSDDEEYVPCD